MRYYFFSLFLFLLAPGCIPRAPMYSLTPIQSEPRWYLGVETVEKHINGISLKAGFIEYREDLLCLAITVKNDRTTDIIVDPARFEYDALSGYPDTASSPAPTHAVDPERRIQNVDAEISKENASYASAAVSSAVIGVFHFVLDIASSTPKSEEHARRDEEERANAENRRVENENLHLARLQSLDQEKSYWQTEPLRITQLAPGEEIGGKVFFHPHKNARFLRVHFRIERSDLPIVYEQKKYTP